MSTKIWFSKKNEINPIQHQNPLINIKKLTVKNKLPTQPLPKDVLEKINALWNDYIANLSKHEKLFSSIGNLLYCAELIGARIQVIRSTNLMQNKIEGIILNETKEMLLVQTERKVVKLIKKTIGFLLLMKNKKVFYINGPLLIRNRDKKINYKPTIGEKLRP